MKLLKRAREEELPDELRQFSLEGEIQKNLEIVHILDLESDVDS